MLPLLTNIWYLKSTKITFLIITFKQIELQSGVKSQIGGNLFALPTLIWFLKIGLDLTEIWPPELESIFLLFISCISSKYRIHVFDPNFQTNKATESCKVPDWRKFLCASKPHMVFKNRFRFDQDMAPWSWVHFFS